jgi:DNA polymerase III delta prime subunit
MHAYLITGREKEVEKKAESLAKNLKAELLTFNLQKIKDVRDLSSFTNLKLNKKTAILLRDIDKASLEALNAFLKNLEEPQENLIFLMTAQSKFNVIPTITSRVKIIKAGNSKQEEKERENADNFIDMNTVERLLYIKEIKDRKSAITFIEEIIDRAHTLLVSKRSSQKMAKIATFANKTRRALLANGNPTLQLTNFILEVE